MSKDTLRITEIFYSLQGEGTTVGLPTTFVRLTGCPLRCGYCDTEYAFYGGETRSLDDIVSEVDSLPAQYITVTGGEPLAQKRVHLLMKQLCDKGYKVSIETSGSMDVSQLDERVVKVLDVKTPCSNEEDKNLHANYAYLNPTDQLKYVIADKADFDWSIKHMLEHNLNNRCEILFSPCMGEMEASQLADWVLQEKLAKAKFPIRFQLQLHKILWGDSPGK